MTVEALFDASLLTLLIFPFLYFFSFRPMTDEISERKVAEAEARVSEAGYRALSENLESTIRLKVVELQQAESLAAVGQMVSVVAHEIRNPLQRIQTGINIMRRRIGDEGDTREILKEIDYGTTMLNEIISELLNYAKPAGLKCCPYPIRDLVRQAKKTLANRLHLVSVSVDLEHEEREIEVDPFKFASVIVNIMSNAIDSMPDGGRLEVKSSFFERDGRELLDLSISDTGCGIEEENMKRIFEPFFTTRPDGVGLGVPVSKKIIEAHNGELIITSKVGEGTKARILVPVENS